MGIGGDWTDHTIEFWRAFRPFFLRHEVKILACNIKAELEKDARDKRAMIEVMILEALWRK